MSHNGIGMKTNFATVLEDLNLWKKVGREIIFRNGMNQSKLAKDMAEEILYEWGEDFEASILSKVITGYKRRLFSPVQFDVFCKILKLTNEERWYLQNAYVKDYYLKKDGLEFDLSIAPQDLDFANTLLLKIRKSRIEGNPQYAIEMASDLDNWLIQKSFSSKYQNDLLITRALAQYEIGIAQQEMGMPDEVVVPIRATLKQIRNIANQCNDEEIFGIACSLLGSVHYIRKSYAAAIRSLTRASEAIRSPDLQLYALRPLALSFANLGQDKEFGKVENKIRGLIEGGNFTMLDEVCYALEAIGRGQGLLNLPQALRTLEEHQKIYSKIEIGNGRAPFRVIQFIRSKLETIQHLHSTEKQPLVVIGREEIRAAIHRAKEIGYQRHASQIEKLSGGLFDC